ncbi:hemerythrin domain-containing protein [Noviherbaspirillum aridicola]|uniref:Hemerythrin-like domain-containing protein n=1 Tax=Noviherbaspirillum aridicola TaxID=2849687 RepID=A0ABQ4Q3E3_9BURK|nr:hemerythrin domain-containing protein [Noviherbaspirillum aridicola]GIZ51690.1 hypothetical protein NCCP691_17040 [Noviherbaspirillum aridicola]
MNSITSYLENGHDECDTLFAAAETGVARSQWAQAQTRLDEFAALLERHFGMEEDILFPALESTTGPGFGPTMVMRQEHAQIRALLDDMNAALGARDRELFLGLSETFNLLLQQHNMKEEGVLYPLADRQLAGESAQLIDAMQAIATAQ